MKHQSSPKQRHRGFSLVELLVVIAVIGVMAGIAIPMVSNINSNASVATAKKQAQQIASVFNSGRAAGAFGGVGSVTAAMNAVGSGSSGQQGLTGTTFVISGVSATMDSEKPATQQASHYLSYADGALVYSPDGASPENTNEWINVSGRPTAEEALALAVAWVQDNHPNQAWETTVEQAPEGNWYYGLARAPMN